MLFLLFALIFCLNLNATDLRLNATDVRKADTQKNPQKKEPQKSEPVEKTKENPIELDKWIQNIQSGWKTHQSYQADFVQTVFSKALHTTDETTGLVTVMKPDKLRWETQNGTIQILNGKKMRIIQKNARRGKTLVTVYSDYTRYVDGRFLELLSGVMDLKKHYHIKKLGEDAQKLDLELKVKEGSQNFVAEISKKGYFLLSLKSESELDTTTTVFKNRKSDIPLDPKIFEYEKKNDDIVHYE